MAMLNPEQAKQLLAANEMLLVKQLKDDKKPLTPAQAKMLQDIIDSAAAGVKKPWADNQTELADALDVDRKTIQRWAKEPTWPGPETANGKYNVAKIRQWSIQQGKRKGHTDDDDIDTAREKAISLKLANERLRNRIAIEKGEWMPKPVAKQVFSKLVIDCKARNYAAIVRFVTLARMSPDTTQAIEAVRKEMDEIWRSMTDTSWFNNPQA